MTAKGWHTTDLNRNVGCAPDAHPTGQRTSQANLSLYHPSAATKRNGEWDCGREIPLPIIAVKNRLHTEIGNLWPELI